MRKPLFALLRGTDGRSLARALIGLLLINALVGGFNAGAMAAPAPGIGVICSQVADDARTALPDNAGDCSCCIFGCNAGCGPVPMRPVAPASPGLLLLAPTPTVPAIATALPRPAPRLLRLNGPRGPPLPA